MNLTQWAHLGPLGALRPIPNPEPGSAIAAARATSETTTLDGMVHVQRAPRARRTWSLALTWHDPALVAHLAAIASGALPGPHYLHTRDAATTNLLDAHLAAPGADGSTLLATSSSLVSAQMPTGPEALTAAVQTATQGPWSATTPLRPQEPVTLSAWSSLPGPAIAWATVSRLGAQLQTGTISTTALAGSNRGSATITPVASAVGLRIALAAGSGAVGALRLTEGPHDAVWLSGRGVPRVIVDDPAETLQLLEGSAVWADYAITIKEVG